MENNVTQSDKLTRHPEYLIFSMHYTHLAAVSIH